MKNEPKVKKLVLRKETLRDLTAANAAEVKGGGKATRYGYGCTGATCMDVCTVVTCNPCHYTKGKPCH